MAQKLSFMLRRRPEFTREEFQRIWLEEHAPLVQSHMDAIACKRYVQVHTDLDAAAQPDRPEPYDGVAELWFDAAFARGSDDERRRAALALLDDERRFIDLAASPLWFGEERPVLEVGHGNRRLTYPLHRVAGMSREEFQHYWWNTHGPLVREHAVPRLRRYVQVHTNADAEQLAGRDDRQAPEPYDGVAILWYDDALPGRAPEDRERIGALIQEDERKFIDQSRSPVWFGREIVIIDR